MTTGPKEDRRDLGLIGDHEYSLIDVYKLNNNLNLIKIRNPWGNLEWNGDWSDKSKLWNDEYKKIVDFNDADDGLFFMNYKDFKI